MRPVLVSVLFVAIAVCAVSQDDAPKPRISGDSLTDEQIAIYRTVLRDYLRGSDGSLNVSVMTEPLDQSDESCLKRMRLENLKLSALVIHKLGQSLASDTKIVLVDPERQRDAIKANDPQNLMKKAIDEHERVTNEQLDQSVKQAFRTGLFTLSEIAFDKEHDRAVVSYSFVCGMLCGHGNTLVLKKIGQNWKITKRCGGWVS
jgi:hypothetical protein